MDYNRFVVAFEGISGSGKSTQINKLHQHLAERGINCIIIKESTISDSIERVLNKMENNVTDADFFHWFRKIIRIYERSKDYSEALTKTNDAEIVIVDRYKYTLLSILMELDLAQTNYSEALVGLLPDPDILFYFDLSAEEAVRRIISRGDPIRKYDSIAGLTRFANNYSRQFCGLKNSNIDYYKIDASNSIDEIHKKIIEIVLDKRTKNEE